jgi:enamine deaminase RidA (YjgF/YER057c/UK114 family)
MTIRRVNPADLARPIGYAHAVVAEGSRIVFLAGQTGLDADGRIVPGDVVDQFTQALTNLLTALRATGGEPEHLASLSVYIVDVIGYRANAARIGEVWRRLVGKEYPAMAAVGVARLWDAEALVELQGYAVLP